MPDLGCSSLLHIRHSLACQCCGIVVSELRCQCKKQALDQLESGMDFACKVQDPPNTGLYCCLCDAATKLLEGNECQLLPPFDDRATHREKQLLECNVGGYCTVYCILLPICKGQLTAGPSIVFRRTVRLLGLGARVLARQILVAQPGVVRRLENAVRASRLLHKTGVLPASEW